MLHDQRVRYKSRKISLLTATFRQVRFLLIARLIPEKGILEYIEAARKIKGNFENVSVQLLGPFDDRPGAIRKSDVQKWVAEGIIEYLGRTDDVRPFLNDCSVYVLPSYHEGMPRSVLEALATGRPVITTNSPGCKETVCEGKNGFLVPVRDSEALYRAMKYFVENPQDIPRMGNESRLLAEERFDVKKVNQKIAGVMGLI